MMEKDQKAENSSTSSFSRHKAMWKPAVCDRSQTVKDNRLRISINTTQYMDSSWKKFQCKYQTSNWQKSSKKSNFEVFFRNENSSRNIETKTKNYFLKNGDDWLKVYKSQVTWRPWCQDKRLPKKRNRLLIPASFLCHVESNVFHGFVPSTKDQNLTQMLHKIEFQQFSSTSYRKDASPQQKSSIW